MPYSFGKRLAGGDSQRQLYGHILRRTAILFFLGTIAGGHLLAWDLSKFYLVNNVLEEIAIGYLVASVIMLNFSARGQLAALAALLLGYWALIAWVPIPGHGAGVLTPQANLPRYIDDLVLGQLRPVKWNFTWILSLPLASSCIVLLGAMAGQLLRSARSSLAKLGWLSGAALACLAVEPRVEPLVSHDRRYHDRILGAFRGSGRLGAVGGALSGHRRGRLSPLGVLLCGDRKQLDRRVHGRALVRFSPDWEHLRERVGEVGGTVERTGPGLGSLCRD